jgi:hypothetical protein
VAALGQFTLEIGTALDAQRRGYVFGFSVAP